MKITLRKRNKGAKTSLYLDYYSNGKRKYEYLRLYLNPNPKTSLERKLNKETIQLAESIKAKRQLEIQNLEYGFENFDKINYPFYNYLDEILDKHNESNGNIGNWKAAITYFKKWEYADVSFKDINAEWLEDLKFYFSHNLHNKSGRKLTVNTCSSYFNKIRAAIKEAVRDGYLAENPCLQVPGIKEAETMREFLTLEELQRLTKVECGNPLIKNAFLFSALTGLRFSDVQKLTWSEIQHSNEIGYYLRFKQKKTKGQETLPITEDALQFTGEPDKPNEIVFKDLIYSYENNAHLLDWVQRAGINKHITFHCARHTFATLQLTFGTDIYTVSKLLGHKDIKTTEIYAKVIDDKKKAAANKIHLKL